MSPSSWTPVNTSPPPELPAPGAIAATVAWCRNHPLPHQPLPHRPACGSRHAVDREEPRHAQNWQFCALGRGEPTSGGQRILDVHSGRPRDPVPLEYSIERATWAITSGLDAVMVGWPGAAQDRLPADVPSIRRACPGRSEEHTYEL